MLRDLWDWFTGTSYDLTPLHVVVISLALATVARTVDR